MDDKGTKCQILHRQANNKVFKAFNSFELMVENSEPAHNVDFYHYNAWQSRFHNTATLQFCLSQHNKSSLTNHHT